MPKKLYEESNIQEIASTIREKNGTQDTYKVSQMAGAMSDLIGPPAYNNMILAQDTQPTSEYNKVWFDTDADDEYTFPQIDDNNVSSTDTWSSQKIKAEDDELKSATNVLFTTKGFADAILTLGGYFEKNGTYHQSATNWISYCFDVNNIFAVPNISAYTNSSAFVNILFFSVIPKRAEDLNTTTFVSFKPLVSGSGAINNYKNVSIPANAKSMVIVNMTWYTDGYAQIIYKRYDESIDKLDVNVGEIEESIKATPNVVRAFFDVWNANDFCIVDDEFWFYKTGNNAGVSAEYPDTWRRYKLIDGSLVLQATIYCDFGHWNTVDYCKKTDCLIFGNGANSESTEGNWFAVVPNAKSLSGNVSLENVGIKYNVNIGYKVQAVWGDDNLGQYNIAVVFSNNATTIKQYLLLKDANGQFNGEKIEIGTATLADQTGVGGADYWDGKLIIGGGRFNIAEIDVLGGYTHKEQERHYYTNDGTPVSGSMQGVVIDSKYKWIFFNYTSGGNSRNCLLQMAR